MIQRRAVRPRRSLTTRISSATERNDDNLKLKDWYTIFRCLDRNVRWQWSMFALIWPETERDRTRQKTGRTRLQWTNRRGRSWVMIQVLCVESGRRQGSCVLQPGGRCVALFNQAHVSSELCVCVTVCDRRWVCFVMFMHVSVNVTRKWVCVWECALLPSVDLLV